MSILTTQKQIKNTYAVDITHYDDKTIKELRQKEQYFDEVAWSKGLYGVNGLLLQGHNTGTLYKITARVTSIYSV